MKHNKGWAFLWFVIGLFLGGGIMGWAYANVNGIVLVGVSVVMLVVTFILEILYKRGMA